jgi:hypothetical protein
MHAAAGRAVVASLINNLSESSNNPFLLKASVLLTKYIITPTVTLSTKEYTPKTKAPSLPLGPTT